MTYPKLSIVMPGIRVYNWDAVYQSIIKSFSGHFELIIVGPYQLTPTLQSHYNVKHVKDYGSPMRASQIGATLAEGEFITWTADDGVFLPGQLDALLTSFAAPDPPNVVIGKYTEGGDLHDDSYYLLGNAYPRTPYIDPSWWIFNLAVMRTHHFLELGGWDCRFEACPCGHADLAVRAQRDGSKVHFHKEAVLQCSHMPGTTGDHAPIHYAQTEHDSALYYEIHNDPRNVSRIAIPMDNWRNAPSVWTRRFT